MYTVTYNIVDKDGATAIKTITVTVNEKDKDKETIPDNNESNNNNVSNNKNDVPQTGDVGNIGLLGTMLVGSSGILAFLLGKKVRRNKYLSILKIRI
ncbi:LPXTG cell wall anchor domain-containing protein [Clostridium nigeriense]|uniref:LPXTG cell wall anchor domain-containing protein n=1 Tax=Clostridium nigeriense TaxID=1805470 RepID=UPI003D3326C0